MVQGFHAHFRRTVVSMGSFHIDALEKKDPEACICESLKLQRPVMEIESLPMGSYVVLLSVCLSLHFFWSRVLMYYPIRATLRVLGEPLLKTRVNACT